MWHAHGRTLICALVLGLLAATAEATDESPQETGRDPTCTAFDGLQENSGGPPFTVACQIHDEGEPYSPLGRVSRKEPPRVASCSQRVVRWRGRTFDAEGNLSVHLEVELQCCRWSCRDDSLWPLVILTVLAL